MSKKKHPVIRFGVKNKNLEFSAVWRCWTSSSRGKSDTYIAVRALAGAIKISLHESGSWQIGFTKEYSDNALKKGYQMPESRHMDIWNNSGQISDGIVRAYQIYIPSKAVCSPYIEGQEDINIIWAEAPEDENKATVFSFIISEREIELSEGLNLIGNLLINNGKKLYIMSSTSDIPMLPQMKSGKFYKLTESLPSTIETGILRVIVPCHNSDGQRFLIDTIIDPKLNKDSLEKMKNQI